MDLATLTLFIPACFALNMAPGPNNLLSVSNSTRYGYRTSCLAGIGRLLAFAGMIALASAGLAVVLQTSELLFYGIKILGAAYLFYLAFQLWRANPETEQAAATASVGVLALARQEGSENQDCLGIACRSSSTRPKQSRRSSRCSARCSCAWNGSPSAPMPTWVCTCVAGSPSRAASGFSTAAAPGCCRGRPRYC